MILKCISCHLRMRKLLHFIPFNNTHTCNDTHIAKREREGERVRKRQTNWQFVFNLFITIWLQFSVTFLSFFFSLLVVVFFTHFFMLQVIFTINKKNKIVFLLEFHFHIFIFNNKF